MNKMQNQQGVILVVALVMLLVMTAVGVTLMNNSTLQERMAGNSRSLLTARANAESALRTAEFVLQDLSDTGTINYDSWESIHTYFNDPNNTAFHLTVPAKEALGNSEPATPPTWDMTVSSNWVDSLGSSVHGAMATLGSPGTTPPHYFVEYIGTYRQSQVGKRIALDSREKTGAQSDDVARVFKITAIGFAENADIYSVLQSTFMSEQ